MLIAIAREQLAPGQRRLRDELLGAPELEPEQVRMLQRTIRECGAIDEVEALITSNVATAMAALEDAPLSRDARGELSSLARAVTRRTS